jgi:predicted glycosyltransferase involved in capsule biosynthesis
MKITTVTPTKIFRTKDGGYSRNIERIEAQLKSLRSQKTNAKIYPIISDLSSDLEIIKQFKRICKKYDAKYINTKTNLVWNKPLALNVGIKASGSNSDLIIALDADIVLRQNVVKRCISKKDNNNVIVCQTYMYNEDMYNFKDFSKKNFERCRGKGKFLNLSGNGGLQCFDRKWLFRTRGYDERYSLWGGIDNEIIKRAKFDKKEVVWLNNINKEILLIHLNHSKHLAPGLSREFVHKYKHEYNVKYYKSKWTSAIVNPKSWGSEKKIVGPRYISGDVAIC